MGMPFKKKKKIGNEIIIFKEKYNIFYKEIDIHIVDLNIYIYIFKNWLYICRFLTN